MCFYFSINKVKGDRLEEAGVLTAPMLALINPNILVNGFAHPLTPVVSSNNPQMLEMYRWGLVPGTVGTHREASHFLREYSTLNAMSEKLQDSKLYAESAESRHCLVLASGFFEWQHKGRQRIPHYISLVCENLFAFAGIWDSWVDEHGVCNYTYSILTTKANEFMGAIHNSKKRMPVILPFQRAKEWLTTSLTVDEIPEYVQSLQPPKLKAYTIQQFLPIPSGFVPHEGMLYPVSYQTLDTGSQLSLDF